MHRLLLIQLLNSPPTHLSLNHSIKCPCLKIEVLTWLRLLNLHTGLLKSKLLIIQRTLISINLHNLHFLPLHHRRNFKLNFCQIPLFKSQPRHCRQNHQQLGLSLTTIHNNYQRFLTRSLVICPTKAPRSNNLPIKLRHSNNLPTNSSLQ